MALSLLTSAQTCVSSDKYLTIRVCDGCFVEVPVSELADTYRYVGELLTDVLQLAAGEGGRGRWGVNGPDPERAKDYSILLNGEKPPELITANTEIESRLLDRIRRFAGWPADLVPSEGKSSRAKAGPVAAPHWHGDDRSVRIFSPISQKFVSPLKQKFVKVKATEVTLGFYHEKTVHMFEVMMWREGDVEWTRAHPQPPEIGLDVPTRLTVAGLEPETLYKFRVRACTETGATSPWTKAALSVLTDKHIEKETPLPKRQRKAKVDSPHAARAHAEVPQHAPATGPTAAGHSAGSSTTSDGGLQSPGRQKGLRLCKEIEELRAQLSAATDDLVKQYLQEQIKELQAELKNHMKTSASAPQQPTTH